MDEIALPIRNATCKCGFMGYARIAEPCEKFQKCETDEDWNEADCVECGHWLQCHSSDCADGKP